MPNDEPVSNPSNTIVKDSKGVQFGNNNVQNNTYYINASTPSAAPHSESLKTNTIDPWLAAAYYDRTKLYPAIDGEICRNPVSMIFIIGEEFDWHEGLIDRLKIEFAHHQNDGVLDAEIEWLNDAGEGAEYDCWTSTLKGLGDSHMGGSVDDIQKKIVKLIGAQTKNRKYSRVMIHFKVDQPIWCKDDQLLVAKLISDWKRLYHELAVHMSEQKRIHISLIFSVVEERNFMSKLKFWGRGKREVDEYPTSKKLKPFVEKGFFRTLPLVSKKDADDWVRVMRERFGGDVEDEKWWAELAKQMKQQFSSLDSMPHDELKDKMIQDTFVKVLTYRKS